MRLSIQQILATLVAAAAATCAAVPTEEPSWRDVLFSFENANPTDFFHLGNDGVLRHFSESGRVLNYAPLSPQQISQALSDTSSFSTAEEKEHLSQVFENVDGRNVKGLALLNPPAYIYPTSFLANRRPSETSEVPQSDLGLNPKLGCVARRCYPRDSCTRYPYCTRCVVRDWRKEGECE
ncbi:hypothetical protein BDV28DRAFT_148924 [Aspergillus coremiiformis]|uniref:Uncharacterized protein n=1 Tax=Aspergillus coremiiformis TaxID=138285 RepID=A0A5N6Z4H8_9EURO|nr:hypothetical protein BDV28DRAFT_148924 [Aspergillus coremiiformis]